jgi:hypothetical protein
VYQRTVTRPKLRTGDRLFFSEPGCPGRGRDGESHSLSWRRIPSCGGTCAVSASTGPRVPPTVPRYDPPLHVCGPSEGAEVCSETRRRSSPPWCQVWRQVCRKIVGGRDPSRIGLWRRTPLPGRPAARESPANLGMRPLGKTDGGVARSSAASSSIRGLASSLARGWSGRRGRSTTSLRHAGPAGRPAAIAAGPRPPSSPSSCTDPW